MNLPRDVKFEISKDLPLTDFQNLLEADPSYHQILGRYLQYHYQSHLTNENRQEWDETFEDEYQPPEQITLSPDNTWDQVLNEGIFYSYSFDDFYNLVKRRLRDYFSSQASNLPWKIYSMFNYHYNYTTVYFVRQIAEIILMDDTKWIYNVNSDLIYNKKLNVHGYVLISDIISDLNHIFSDDPDNNVHEAKVKIPSSMNQVQLTDYQGYVYPVNIR